MADRRNKFTITLFGYEDEVLSSGTVVLQRDFRGLQRQILSNVRVAYCLLENSNGEKYHVTSSEVKPLHGKQFFSRLSTLFRGLPKYSS